MKMKKILILICSVFALNAGRAQDWHLSMYDAAPMYLNPAMTGVVEGEWRIHAHYRNQWNSVNFKPFNTGLISFDAPVGNWGFGGQIINYRAGIGNYNALQGLASVAYTIPLNKKRSHVITMGVQGGVTQKKVEYQLLTFNNQYTTQNGGGFDSNMPSNESFGGQSFITPDLNAGILYYYARQQSRLNPFVGFSAFNLLEPQESWFGSSNKLPMRFYIHAGTRINITETIYLIPKALWMQQSTFNELTLACDAGFYLKGSEVYVLGGLTYRNKDAFIATIGAKKANYIAKFSYDTNLSQLTPASNGRGGIEISFTYMHQKKDKKKVKVCPQL
ncbi:PorP/SprF family type IX secretion system membrane protein [Paracrocinitomix mangrovi]|uniref:PorP/SprF family type IX secretion system membrane protein n=1 Tax=Paracrocinitomix mangrovi TaxID=2862509 RepID=UPI001EDA3F76|nr:PorP/SprF family type IX secretion system membrane protein [Paracrocinitomix mangrovi]UKN02995.1 PorP/SprF family type IX secretion system membrane protein [Paracrocinitomix mangrovi]